ncbi:MAG: bifunctional chorismate mutase/prephenate dehydratase [Clostridia bacterium]|nr:bifunctional chorismate mutase/prephenate dehydratase [Clostridia bacterium]
MEYNIQSLDSIRERIDEVDKQLVSLFRERMEISAAVAEYKRANGKQVFDAARERSKLASVAQLAGEDFADYSRVLYSTIMSLSRSYQEKILGSQSLTDSLIEKAVNETPKLFPVTAKVACQGIEGAYSQIAAEKLFELPQIEYFKSFEGVFEAIENGTCEYGVLPLENSTAGSVGKVYDLMLKKNFYIVRSFRLKIDHNLLAKKGLQLEDIKEVFSHEQAISQCSAFLKANPQIKVTACPNTAMAARLAAETERNDVAALSSRDCALLYGLSNLAANVQDNANNHTRFICISRKPEIYPGADKTTLMMVAPHKPGALYVLLSHFFAHGINISKLESRPLPESDFEFLFYLDLDVSVYSPKLRMVLAELERQSEQFRYLGSYIEQIG